MDFLLMANIYSVCGFFLLRLYFLPYLQHFNQDIIQPLVSQKGQKYKVCLLGKK